MGPKSQIPRMLLAVTRPLEITSVPVKERLFLSVSPEYPIHSLAGDNQECHE